MLENGELKKAFPRMKGSWEEDEVSFTKEQTKLDNITGIDVNE